MINYYSEIKPVLNKLRKLNVFDSLDVIRKYVYTSIYRKNVGYIQGIESPQYYGIEVYFADFLIKNSLIYSSIVRENKSLVQAKTRKEVCKPIIDLQHIVNDIRMKEHPSVWVSSYFYNQINMQPEGNEKLMLYRHFYMYKEPNVRAVIEKSLGFPLENYFGILFFLYSCFVNHFCRPKEHLFLFFRDSVEGPDAKAMTYLLSVISKPLSELRELCKDDSRYDEDKIMEYYSDSAHIRYPLISFEKKIYCVVPAYILFSALDNLYHILNERNDQGIRNVFAKNYENYIGHIFNHYFKNSSVKYQSEILYKCGKEEKSTSDWIIWDETDICFIDCKIKRMTISGQRANSIDKEWINKVLSDKPFSSSKRKELFAGKKESLTRDIILFGIDLGKIFVCYDNYKNNQIDDFTYMPNKQFHACLLAFEQNFCKTYEIKKDIIRIAQSYRDYHSKEKYSINDDEVMLISSRDMERDIPLIANNGIAKVMEWEHNGDIYKYKEDNTYLRNLCKSTLLDKLLLDINEKVVKLGNM